ncbi:MAG TPA: PLP-dependent aminotransferase family protein [Drouetiella sp.]|jgi:GntR family transcriptional regulator / MocR family aminotransferase
MRSYPAIKLDLNSKTPVFQQLAAEIETLIQTERLRAGQMLPSSREFARFLFVSRGTVVRAYEILTAKGLLKGLKGKGLIVTEAPTYAEPQKTTELPSHQGANDFLESQPDEPLAVEDVTKAAVPQALLPSKRWRELVMKHCNELGRTYQIDALGAIELRTAVCRFLNATRGVLCTPDQISVYTNTDQALDTIARLLVQQGDTVVIEEPGYIGVANIFSASGAKIIANRIDDKGMVVDSLSKLKTLPRVLYTTPISQDPTGIVMPDRRQNDLIEWAKRNDCTIVEDSWDTDFWHGRTSALCMQQKAPEQIIYLYSFWKLLFPLSNACFLVVPKRLTPQLRRLRALINRPPISIELMALTDLLASGEIDALAAKLQKSYRKRRQALIFSLSKAFGRTIQVATAGGGTHIIVQFNINSTRENIIKRAKECGLKILSLDDYYFDGRTTNQFVMFFTCVSTATIDEQVQRFKESLHAKQGLQN